MSSHDMADDLEALRDHLGLPSLRLLGHSNSGAIRFLTRNVTGIALKR